MPEHETRSETLRLGTPFTVGSITLLPIERIVKHAGRGSTVVWFSLAKEPYTLVVRDDSGIRAVDIDAIAVSLEQLRERIPHLDAVLASM